MAQVEIENVLQPGKTYRVDRARFEAARAAFLAALPEGAAPLTPAQVQAGMKAHLPDDLFPGGAKAGWWSKAVQLDLEAKGVIRREAGAPVRLRRA